MTKRCTYCVWPNSDNAEHCISYGYKLKKYWDYSGGKTRFVDTTNNDGVNINDNL